MSEAEAQRLFDEGNALLARGEVEPAIAHLEAAYCAKPTAITAQGATLAALAAQDWKYAKHYGRIACKLAPNWPDNWYRLAAAYWGQGDWPKCRQAHNKCLALDPNHLGAHNMLAMLAGFRGDHESELFHVERLLAATPKTELERFDQAHALLWLGRYPEGWAAYETRHDLPLVINGWRRPMGLDPAKRWDGTAQIDRLLVYFEQGHGDAIQFARYLPLLANVGYRSITVLVHGSLVRLFREIRYEGDSAGEWWNTQPLVPGQPAPEHDAYVGAMSLPHIFGTTIDTIPPPADFGMRWDEFDDQDYHVFGEFPAPKIALCTKGGAVASLDLDRSCHTDAFDRLKSLEGYEIVDFTGRVGDFLETASALLGCEILVTVDSAIAHLAGSLGVPTWVIPPTHLEWRHLRGADVNPWYPTWRYFRRRTTDDWPKVVDDIIQALEAQ